MSVIKSVSCAFGSINLLRRCRSHAKLLSRSSDSLTFNKRQFLSVMDRAMQSSGGERGLFCRKLYAKIENNIQPPAPPAPAPQKPAFPRWIWWLLGSVLTLFLPFWKKRWEKLLKIEDEVEQVEQAMETAADVVETVAAVAEEESAEVAEKLLMMES